MSSTIENKKYTDFKILIFSLASTVWRTVILQELLAILAQALSQTINRA
jgi:hypothetical protein